MSASRYVGRLFSIGLLLAVVLVACRQDEPTPAPTEAPRPTVAATDETAAPAEEAMEEEPTAAPTGPTAAGEPIYLAIIWHQHQPVYFKDPATGLYARPWVRVHATKDYVDMAAMLEAYPNVHATFNLTPSLLRQLQDFEAGARDLYWALTEVPAAELDDEQKQFLLDRFFDTNREIIGRFPRYQQLLNLRDNSDDPLAAYTADDYRDLQVLFNLAWVDPAWLEEAPLADMVAKGRDYDEADKVVLLAEHLRLIEQVIPVHRALQDAGQIEITMTPYAHPILPLLVDTNLARVALPDVPLPATRFTYGQDAIAQVERGVALYEDLFGRRPRGMWPAEGSVAQEIVAMVALNGIEWMASDEGVLANSLGLDSFTRDASEVVVEADALYRPYHVEGRRGGPVAMVYRDVAISDKVGFTYSGMDGALAARDFVDRIHAIRAQLAESGAAGPHLVSVILDGENAWEYYENDGKAFLHTLYQMLSEDPLIRTVTPSEFLELAPEPSQIETLWAGSWISHDFSTWIGEAEENAAWDVLAATRAFLEQYISGPRQGDVSEEALAAAVDQMQIAEGSDWFWWYGADQDSGSDGAFDEGFRNTLKQVYASLGQAPPAILDVPIIPLQAAAADRASTGLLTPTIDGQAAEEDWAAGGVYQASGGVMAGAELFFSSLTYGFDSKNLYLKVDVDPAYTAAAGDRSVDVYLQVPGGGPANNFSRNGTLLGFPANRLLEVAYSGDQATGATLFAAEGDEAWAPAEATEIAWGASPALLELGVPLAALGSPDTGDRLSLRAFHQQAVEVAGQQASVDTDQIPGTGPAALAVPDLGTTTVLIDIADPAGDDHGPGTYTYPTDGVFTDGSYDAQTFQVGFDENNIIFRFLMGGPVENVWGSPNGLSIQTFDVYIDQDGDGQGGVALLPGRNLSLRDGAWDYAVHVEGWTSGIYVPGDEGPQQVAQSSEFQVLADPGQRRVTIRIPKAILGDDPENWRYAALVLSQEGFPSGGVMRVRDVMPTAEQWRIGGAPAGATNHTRVLDLIWANPGDQEAWLSDFEPASAPQSQLTAEDFAAIPLFGIE